MRTLIKSLLISFLLFATPAFGAAKFSDEGTSQGYVNAFDCVGDPIACTKSGITGTITITPSDSVTVNSTPVDTTANFLDAAPVTFGLADGGAGGPDDVTVIVGDAVADGSTKGISSYTARDFSASSGVISSRKGDFWNGSFAESFDADVTSNGTTVTMSIEKSGTGDLTAQFSDGNTAYDTTPADTIALTVGSDASPQGNWIYTLQTAPTTLVGSTSSWPSTEHIKVGFFFVQSAASVQTDSGPFINQNWNNELAGTDSQGHLTHISGKLRHLGSTYFSGVDANGATASYYTISASNTEFISTAGVIEQLHSHTFSAVNTSTGSVVHVVNSSVSAYRRITDLFSITTDSTGATITNNKYFNLVIWGVVNKTGERQLAMVNVPGGFYNSQASAENDISGFDNFSMPREFSLDSGNGFLIARTTFQMGTTWTHVSTVDLRSFNSQSASGGVGGPITDFADNTFTVFDNTDNTKVLAFDIGANVTTGNTRTLSPPDASGNIALTSQTDGTLVDADIPNSITIDLATTVTTNANLTGEVTSVGNAAVVDVTAISGQTLVTAAAGDMVLVQDATDSLLKRVNAGDFLGGGAADTALSNLAAVAINTSLISDTDITDDLGTGDIRWKDSWIETLSSGLTATDTLKIRGRDVDGAAYVDILTITSANIVTADLSSTVTIGGNAILDDTSTSSALTSLGTLTVLQVDNININLNTISSTAGTDLNITPLAGQQIVLDGAIIVDAGVVTGATSITSTSFVGALTGNADTVTTNANLTGEVTSTGNAAVVDVTAISGQTLVTAVATDMVLIQDATDGLLKRADVGDLLGGGGANTALSNLAAVAINLSLTSDTDVTDDLGTGDIRWNDAWIETISSGLTATDVLKLRGRDVDGAAYIDILTITSANDVTADLNAITTLGGNTILTDVSTASALTSVGTLTGLTVNSSTITLSQDTNFVLSGGVNGVSFDTDVLSIDATNDRVGIGVAAPLNRLHIEVDDATNNDVTIVGAFDHRTTGTAANGIGAAFIFAAEDSAGSRNGAVRFVGMLDDVTNGTEEGAFRVDLQHHGAWVTSLKVAETETHLFGNIGIGTETPLVDFGSISGDFGGTFSGVHIKGTEGIMAVEGSTSAALYLADSGNTANKRIVLAKITADKLFFQQINDDLTVGLNNLLVMELTNGNLGTGTVSPFSDFGSATGDFSSHRGIHVDGEANTGAYIVEGDSGAKLVLADSGGATNDKIFEWEVDGGVLTGRSLNDDLTTLVDNAIVVDLGTGAVEVGVSLNGSNAAGPAILNEAASLTNPTLIPNKADPDTGIAWSNTNILGFTAGGVNIIQMNNSLIQPKFHFGLQLGAAPLMQVVAASATVPGFTYWDDEDTGVGKFGADAVSLISGGVEGLRLTEANSLITIATDTSTVTCASDVCTDAVVSKLYVTTELAGAADVLTIADAGVAGTERTVCLAVDGGDDLTVTPTNFLGGSTITLDTAGECVNLGFDGTNWYVESTNGGVIA